MMDWVILSILFTAISGTMSNYTLSVGDVKRLDVTVETTYTFLIKARAEFAGVIFQLHSQHHNITLSKSPNFTYGDTTKGRDIGLWQEISDNIVQFTFYATISHINNDTSEQVLILAAVTSISNEAPLPGGCTLVSPLNVDPNLQLTYSMYTTTIIFQDGDLGYTPTKNETPPQCSGGINAYHQLKYTIYRRLLDIRDYSINSLFNALEDIIKPNLEGLPHLTKDSSGIKSVTIDSFYGDGVIYIVLATSLVNGQTSAYVPAVTYACDFDLREAKCRDALPLINIIVSPLLGLVGLFMCLFSHRLFHIEVLVFSWIIITLVTYIIFSTLLHTTHTIRVGLSLSSSIVIAFLLFLIWFFTGWYLLFIFMFSGITGFLIGAILMYSPFGMLTVWKISYVYGLLMACFVVLALIPGVIFSRAMNIFASSLIGSYLVIYAIGTFVFTSLNEIVMRVVKIVSVHGYLATDEVYPFQLNDILLSCGWFVLLVASIIVQALLARGRDPFPKISLYKQCRQKWRNRSNRLHQPAINNDENRKLLNSYCSSPSVHSTYGAFTNY